MNTDQIRTRMTELRANLTMLAEVDGDLDDTQRSDWTAFNTEYDELSGTLTERTERATRYAALLEDAPAAPVVTGGDVHVANGDGAAAAGAARATVQIQNRPDPDEAFDRSGLHVSNDQDGYTYRDRAMRAIESWNRSIPADFRESAEKLVTDAPTSKGARQIAEHVMRTSDPKYVNAFYRYLAGGPEALNDSQRMLIAEANRAMSEGSTSAGGAVVPPFLDPSIILTNAGITNPFRQISTVKTIATQTWKGVTSAGVTAEWTAEAAEMTDASPTFANPSITPTRADAYVQASFEMIEDTDIATELAMLFADARDRLEGTAFAVGTGSTQPFGIVTELQLVTASRVAANTNGTLGAVDIFGVDNNLGARWRNNASFMANKSIWNQVRQLATGPSQQQSAFWVDLGGGLPPKLIGYDVYQASGMQGTISTATASNDDLIVLGDFRQYYIVDRIGMSVVYNPLVLGTNRRPTGEVGWAAFWRVGARTVNADAFRMLRL